ncbi:MAG: bifunctional diaminohydroxyphosphoribosylaminopyrimidine deaminase/5-amino-6-(5-phosphoribosylamino)uracil reductase RibD [Nitrospirales bacterium]|nr:bifunctional diaminohydroxyphosphoribosylaminopyrimidine deaminase/5-amino-6-(5-phosphoribosylamino)uracil reductase RibD [Nitrospirales bacterium]
MTRALSLAKRGKGKTSPNPMVGAVIVNHGTIVGEAFHRKAGEPHAEVLALQRAGPQARGGILYVTLEPCVHVNKRTPPCVPLLLQSGLTRICVAMVDPNPQVAGKGILALRQAGFAVTVGICESEARSLNRVYSHWIRTGRPLVTLKGAMTLDGKLATKTGQSQWITGEAARRDVHRVRNRVDAILVGIGTILADDPDLSARGNRPGLTRRQGRQPVRVVLDSRLRIPVSAKVLRSVIVQPTIVCTTSQASKTKIRQLEGLGVQVWVLSQRSRRVFLPAVLKRLGQQGLTSVLIEGGGTLNASALKEQVVDRVQLYIAPKLLGGQDAMGLIGGTSPNRIQSAWQIDQARVKKIAQDFCVTGMLVRPESRKEGNVD